MKEYTSIVLNGYTTKQKLDALLKEYADVRYRIHSTVMNNIIIMEREKMHDPEDSDNK